MQITILSKLYTRTVTHNQDYLSVKSSEGCLGLIFSIEGDKSIPSRPSWIFMKYNFRRNNISILSIKKLLKVFSPSLERQISHKQVVNWQRLWLHGRWRSFLLLRLCPSQIQSSTLIFLDHTWQDNSKFTVSIK